MAKYSYNELKVAAAEGRRIGAYMGSRIRHLTPVQAGQDNGVR